MSAARIEDFLAKAARTPFAYGQFDCCLWLADWVAARRGGDPAAQLRGRYKTALGCHRLLRREGGLQAVIALCAASAGLEPTAEPLAGDVGVLEAWTARGREPVGGLCTGPRWAILGSAGLIVGPAAPVVAWRV